MFLSGDLRENPLTPLGSRGQKRGFGMFLVLRLGVVCASLLARLLACFCRCFASGSVGLVGSTGFYAYVTPLEDSMHDVAAPRSRDHPRGLLWIY